MSPEQGQQLTRPDIGNIVRVEGGHIDIHGLSRSHGTHARLSRTPTQADNRLALCHQKPFDLGRMVVISTRDTGFRGRKEALSAMHGSDNFE